MAVVRRIKIKNFRSIYSFDWRPTEGFKCIVVCGWLLHSKRFFAIAMVCQYSRVSGLFVWRLPLALISSASKVPIG